MKQARSDSLMGLQAASVPSPNITKGLPVGVRGRGDRVGRVGARHLRSTNLPRVGEGCVCRRHQGAWLAGWHGVDDQHGQSGGCSRHTLAPRPPVLTSSTWPATLLKKAVGRTMLCVMSVAACACVSMAGVGGAGGHGSRGSSEQGLLMGV